jgi:glucose/arabinose dehydrogenase
MLRDNGRLTYDGGLKRGAPLLAAALLSILSGCGPGAARTPLGHRVTTASASPAGSPTPSDPLAGCGAAVRFSTLPVLARLQNADDVSVAPDGSIWTSDATGELEHLSTAGSLLQRIVDTRAPEGIVVRPDGSLLVAEQGPDRVVLVQPSQPSLLRTVVQLNLPAGQMGVDGIGYDPTIDAVLVPDSPNGTLLEKPVTGGTSTQLASGLGRPVGVAMVEDGSFVVTAENATGLLRIPARGGAEIPVPGVSDADDVVMSGPLAYVTSLGSHQLLAVDLTTLRTRVLVTAVASPQGLAQLPDGKLVLTDSTTGTIATVQGCG